MQDPGPDLNERIASRVRGLRAGKRFSLDVLATRSGVSRSMISLVERGESSPTASVLEKLATGLGVTLAALFESPSHRAETGPLSRRQDQLEWRDPGSGYLRRSVSPPGRPQPLQIAEVHFPPRGRVTFDNAARELRVHQQVWLLEGSMDVSVGAERHRLREGDCLGMTLDHPTTFHNPTRKAARYAVVTTWEAVSRGRE